MQKWSLYSAWWYTNSTAYVWFPLTFYRCKYNVSGCSVIGARECWECKLADTSFELMLTALHKALQYLTNTITGLSDLQIFWQKKQCLFMRNKMEATMRNWLDFFCVVKLMDCFVNWSCELASLGQHLFAQSVCTFEIRKTRSTSIHTKRQSALKTRNLLVLHVYWMMIDVLRATKIPLEVHIQLKKYWTPANCSIQVSRDGKCWVCLVMMQSSCNDGIENITMKTALYESTILSQKMQTALQHQLEVFIHEESIKLSSVDSNNGCEMYLQNLSTNNIKNVLKRSN